MNKNYLTPNMKDDFVVLIISHGRPYYHVTWDCLERSGYTGKKVVVIDNLDDMYNEYMASYGNENVYVFNKVWKKMTSDTMNNFNDMRATLYVRNACWDIANELGYKYFLVLDDDYGSFCHKREECEKTSKKLDYVFALFVEYLANTKIKCIAFSQGGDHIGGYNPEKMYKRKVMNSFFCKTDEPFDFYGTMNDDVNSYLINGARGDIFITFYPFMLHQATTQTVDEGLTNIYETYGTYVKSFYSVMAAPNCCCIRLMGEKSPRLHHSIKWNLAVPCIIGQEYKK